MEQLINLNLNFSLIIVMVLFSEGILKLLQIRIKLSTFAKILITLGACAAIGGIYYSINGETTLWDIILHYTLSTSFYEVFVKQIKKFYADK